ncbi:hypothetical protein [Nannocystis bainbridge]|uniref:Uncharacterized protein n=1 Tax=Nannocystis bainbridge TaxID=2995303 RepID=A0ABT5E3E2_9BACT|nr:hypothetical protein [Nannocystis bainbridge]MDC0719953.1 hypothetical protein [Nannocystis bainbridge]
MNSCPDNPECPYRVTIARFKIDEIRFAESASAAAVEVAEDHELPDLHEPIVAVVAEVPAGPQERYVIRAFPVLMYEADPAEADLVGDADGRRASVESDPLTAPARLPGDSPDGSP